MTLVRRLHTISVAAGLAMSAALLYPASAAGAASSTPPLPGIHHVWQIELENESESASFAANGTYLNSLTTKGVFLPDYYATGHVSNDNYISGISGQVGNPANDSDCARYVDFEGTVSPAGYPAGAGCVYPSSVLTLPDQLTAAGLTWRGWMEDMGNDTSRETPTCGQPVGPTPGTAGSSAPPGTTDNTQTATATDQYAARHNPFVYFHSLTDVPPGATSSPCQENVLPMKDFTLTTPANWNWITPNLCDDGHDTGCKGPDITGANPGPGGMVSANAFLRHYIPLIQASPAYQADGLIVITFDEAAANDTSSCCGEVPGTSGVQNAAPGLGGGQVGALLLSPLLTPHTSSCAYNHFSLLRTYEDLFAIRTGGADGAGHLGNASVANSLQPDLVAASDPCAPGASVPETPLGVLLVVCGVLAGGSALYLGRRRMVGPRS